MNSGAIIVLSNKATLCSRRSDGRLQTRACITTQVHMKTVKRQVRTRPSVPRPGLSRTQPTDSIDVGDGLEPHPKQEVESIAAARLLRRLIDIISLKTSR